MSAEALFAWHERPGALARLLPPGLGVFAEERGASFVVGARWAFVERRDPALRHALRVVERVPGRRWRVELVEGPLEGLRLTRELAAAAPEPSSGRPEALVRDELELPLSLAGRGAERLIAALTKALAFGLRRAALDLERLEALGAAPRHVVVSGSSGMIGRDLVALLRAGGHRVDALVRRAPRPGLDEVRWDPRFGALDVEAIEGADALVHLAGAGVADARWSPARLALLRESRVDATRALVAALARMSAPPRALVVASGSGIYREGEPDALDESGPSGDDFLARLARDWEEAAAEASVLFGARVSAARIGVVLSPSGGALARMLGPFAKGLGGPVGGGAQRVPWIGLEDTLGALVHLLAREFEGPLNVVAPQAVPQRELAVALGRALGRPARVPLPALGVSLLFGEMGRALLLADRALAPRRLLEGGFRFHFPELDQALAHELTLARRD